MPDGSIRIKTRIDNNEAKKDAKEFEKIVNNAAENAKDSGDKATINLDVSQAEKEIKRLEKEIEKYTAKISQLESGKLGEYNAEREALNKSTKADLAKATSPDQRANVLSMHDTTMAQIESKYSSVLAKADEYGKIIAQNDAKIQQLRNAIDKIKSSQSKVNSEQSKANTSTSKTTTQASRLSEMLKSAKNTAAQFARSLGVTAYNGIKKVGGVIKNTIIPGLKRSFSHLKNMRKQTSDISKGFMRTGLALLGIEGLMTGVRQIVTSALNDNEKLQNQLTAIKGILGQALTPVINGIVTALTNVVTLVDKVYQAFTGTSLIAKYNAQQADKMAESTSDAAAAAEEYQNQLAGFDEVNKLSDNTSSSGSSSGSGDSAATFEPSYSESVSKFAQMIKEAWEQADFTSVGNTISAKLVSMLQNIDWDNIKSKGFGAGKSFATLINGLFGYTDKDGNTLMSSIGQTIGQSFNTLISVVNGFAINLNWKNLGSELSNGISSAIKTIDWKALFTAAINLGAGFGDFINGIFSYKDSDGDNLAKNLATGLSNAIHTAFLFVIGFVKTVDWQQIGTSISESIQGIDWVRLFNDLFVLLSDSIIGLLDLIIGFIEGIDWGKAVQDIFEIISGIFTSIDWTGIANKLSHALGALAGAIVSIIVQCFIERMRTLFNIGQIIKDYFDEHIKEAQESGGNIAEGILQGIKDVFKNIWEWIKTNVFQPFIDGFKKAFNIHSPSKDPDILELGKNIIEGIFNGIVDWIKNIKTWFKENVFDKITDAWSNFKELTISIGGKIQDSFNKLKEKWDSIKNKVNTSSIKGSIQSTFNTLKSKWDSIKNKTNTASIKGSIQKTFNTLKSKWDSIKNKTNTSTIKGSIASSFSNALSKWNSLKSKAVTVTTKLKDSITSGIQKILNSLVSMVNKVITALNRLPGINISKITAPRLAKGGIVNNPGRGVTVTAGEAGPEAILPLNDSAMSRLAAMISENQKSAAGQIVIPIYMDSKKITTYVIDAQNKQAFALNKGGAY